MSSLSENARTTTEFRGSRIECSSAVSANCLKAIEIEDKEEFADLISAKGANLNEICVYWATCRSDSRPERYTVTPLTLAAKFASCDFIPRMLKHGADPNVNCDLTPLGVAVSVNKKRLVALLLDSGADVNLKSCDTEDVGRKHTPFHIACSKNFFTMAIYLLLKGALPDDDDEIEYSFASCARQYRNWKEKGILLTSFSDTVHPSARKYRYCETLTDIFPTSFLGTVHSLCRKRIKQKEEKRREQKEIDNDFQKFSCSILDKARNTPLHYACADGDKEMVQRILKRIHQSANIDAQNIENQSPAEVAFDFGRLEIVFMLIEHGCSLSERMLTEAYNCGNTLLHIACKQNRVAVAEKLMTAGSSLTVINSEGRSAMHYAWLSGELRDTVLDHVFQDPSIHRTMNIRTHDPALRLSGSMRDFDMPTADQLALYTTLCRVASEVPLGSYAVTDVKVRKYPSNMLFRSYHPFSGVNRNRKRFCSSCGKLTPKACYLLRQRALLDDALLLSACCGSSYANKELALELVVDITQSSESDLKIGIEKSIEKGANVHATDCRGNTPLHLACRDGARAGLRILLDCGANPYVVNNEGMTPLDCADGGKRGQLLLCLVDRFDDDTLSTVSRKGEASTKLMMLASACVLSQQLAYRLACDGARINPPATPSCDSNAPRSCLLDILARQAKWGAVCELVRMGCCDYTDVIFNCMFRISCRDRKPFYNKVQMWTWFSLAGFWKNDDFTAQFESFLEVKFHQSQPEHNTHTDASSATATTELEWLKDDVRNPPSLFRQCVYTIRRQLILADTAGTTIFPRIEKLPMPSRLKENLKLEALEAHAECFVEPY